MGTKSDPELQPGQGVKLSLEMHNIAQLLLATK